jgi:hypothetical protein
VPLPETIPVRFTEEDAEYVNVRPVKRQTFRLRELLDMVLSVTGRDVSRIQKILHSGTIVYHFFRYTWHGFDADTAEISGLLADFPSDFPPGDPRRVFSPQTCAAVLIESAAIGRQPVEVPRAAAERKAFFASRSFWDSLLAFVSTNRGASTNSSVSSNEGDSAANASVSTNKSASANESVSINDDNAASNANAVTYCGYSFARRADLFRLALTPEQSAAFLRDASRLAPRNLRPSIQAQAAPPRIVFVCPRSN